jgi:1-acyl-sn-glycerol-3-phosphate acyltransferase
MFKRDIFGHLVFVKKMLISLIGIITFSRYSWRNKTVIEGTEHLDDLPHNNVLFVSNHQTYFADVIAMLHVFCSHKWGFRNRISNPVYLLSPRHNTYFVAAEETMKAGIIPKIFAYVGSISVKRTFREAGQDINRKVRIHDVSNIGKALEDGWVITFPQGTTKAFAPGRRGTTLVIKKYQPIVVPVVINGFRRAFDKKGLKLKKKGTTLSIRFKAPMQMDYNEEPDIMLQRIMQAIEQSEEFRNKAFVQHP